MVINLLIIFHLHVVYSQDDGPVVIDAAITNAIELSESALYEANFNEALRVIDIADFENELGYEPRHEILLTIQKVRVRALSARLSQWQSTNEEFLNDLKALIPKTDYIEDTFVKAKLYAALSFYFTTEDLDQCLLYENKALEILSDGEDNETLAIVRASRLSREMMNCLRQDDRERALELISEFRKEIEFSSRHSKYVLSYNTRHLANIYKVFELDHLEALHLYQWSLELREEIGFKPFLPASYYSLGEAHLLLSNDDIAIENLIRSAELAEEIGFLRYRILPLVKLGDVYLEKGELVKARQFYRRAIDIASSNEVPEALTEEIMSKMDSTQE